MEAIILEGLVNRTRKAHPLFSPELRAMPWLIMGIVVWASSPTATQVIEPLFVSRMLFEIMTPLTAVAVLSECTLRWVWLEGMSICLARCPDNNSGNPYP